MPPSITEARDASQGPRIVLLTGMSGVGKSSVSKALRLMVPECNIISQDEHFADAGITYAAALASGNCEMERAEHVDWARVLRVVRAADGLVLVEGHCLPACIELVDMAAAILVLNASPDECRARRLGRRERSAEEAAELSRYFDEIVAPAHREHTAPRLRELLESGDPRAVELDARQAIATVIDEMMLALRRRHCLPPGRGYDKHLQLE